MITQERVQELFNYDPETGILTNKISRSSRAMAGEIVGSLNTSGYLHVKIDRVQYLVHRICFIHYHGLLPSTIDHKDTNPLNNRILNLRECTNHQNSYNAKMAKNNTSGVKGVFWEVNSKKWRAQINFNGKKKHIGLFSNIEEARKAVDNARIELHGDFHNHG